MELDWARDAWKTLHFVARYNRVPVDKFLASFMFTLHCDPCRPHFAQMILDHRVCDFFKWTVDRHNDVNRRLHKPEIEVVDALRLYPYEFLPEYVYNYLYRIIWCQLKGRKTILAHLEWFSPRLREFSLDFALRKGRRFEDLEPEDQDIFLRSIRDHFNPEIEFGNPVNNGCGVEISEGSEED